MRISVLDGTQHEVLPGTFLLGYRGSHAHGLYVPKDDPKSIDDVDLMGFAFGEPRHYLGLSEWGSRGTRDFWEDHLDLVYYEARKAFQLLLQGNPNIVSSLWLRPADYLLLTEAGKRLIDARSIFVGKHVYAAFAGYASAQFQKMESREPAELREYLGVTAELKRRGAHPNHRGEFFPVSEDHPKHFYDWTTDKLIQRLRSFQRKGENLGYLGDKRKQLVLEHGYDSKNAAHCVRLLRMCKEFLSDGVMRVYRTTDRQELLDIKAGKWSLMDIKSHAEQLFAEVKLELSRSSLPAGPDFEAAEKLLIDLVSEVIL